MANPKEKTKPARDKWQKKAQENDAILEKCIKEYPGMTQVELEKIFKINRYKFKRSYLKNAYDRLERSGRIIARLSTSKDGKIVKRYEFNSATILDIKKVRGVLKIPIKLLNKPEQWKDSAIIYGIKNNEIKISPVILDKLEETSFFSKKASLSHDNEKLYITLPTNVTDYYNIEYDNYDTEIDDSIITVTTLPKIKKVPRKAKFIKNILLLEDNEYWASEFTNKFTKYGYTVYVARTIEEAKEITNSKEIDYCILDDEIHYKKEAENFFLELKKKNRKIHGIFITVNIINDSTRARLTELGFSAVIEKHRTDDEMRDLEEIVNEQILRMEMVYK